MARLLLNILIITLLALFDPIAAGPLGSQEIISSIKKVQKKHSKDLDLGNSVRIADDPVTEASSIEEKLQENPDNFEGNEGKIVQRQHKMLGFYGYLPAFAPIPAFYPIPPIQSPDIYSDYNNWYQPASFPPTAGPTGAEGDEDEGDEAMSRANSKKRPSNQFKNSPIYYIRLPPTPYMYVPGLGYISQPPTIQPLAPVMPPPPPPPPVSPFYNLPINFVSNGKPTGVYQWPPTAAAHPQVPPQIPTNHYSPYPQQRPQRPYRPSYNRPPPPPQHTAPSAIGSAPSPYAPQTDSKITNLKGSYLFNGRPEEIYILPQSPYTANYYPDPYSYQNYNQGYNGYY